MDRQTSTINSRRTCALSQTPADKQKSGSVHLPVGHDHRCEQAPHVEQHAHPARHDSHPHRDLGTADVDVLFVVRVRIRLHDVPIVAYSLMSKETGIGGETRERTSPSGASRHTSHQLRR